MLWPAKFFTCMKSLSKTCDRSITLSELKTVKYQNKQTSKQTNKIYLHLKCFRSCDLIQTNLSHKKAALLNKYFDCLQDSASSGTHPTHPMTLSAGGHPQHAFGGSAHSMRSGMSEMSEMANGLMESPTQQRKPPTGRTPG